MIREAMDGLRAAVVAATALVVVCVAPAAQAQDDDGILRGLVRMMTGIEVNIGGGDGRAPDDPVVLLDANPALAGLTQRIVIGTAFEVMGVGWRLTERAAPGPDNVEHLRFEMLGPPDKPQLSGPLDFYFDVAASGGRNLEWKISQVPDFRAMPFDLAWAHFEKTNDYETQTPGMGYGLVYRLPAGVISLFVYGKPADVGAARAEFDQAAADIKRADPNRAVELLGAATVEADFFRQDYIIAGNWSSLGLTVVEGRFVKFRITGANDPVHIGFAEAAIAELRQELGR